jgi:diacylglycerol kinase (ATP)
VNPRKFLESLKYALEGIAYCTKTQRNMRIHFVFAVFALVAGIILNISKLEFIIIIIVISMVFICEIFNTAIEKAIDTSTQEYHPVAKIAKDVAAGAVLVSAINAIVVGCIIYGRYFWTIVLKVIGNGS